MNSRKENRPLVSDVSSDPLASAGALYVHVPFCRAKCRYCDFYSRLADEEIMDAYVRAVLTERELREDQIATPLRSVYFGGGTPTVLGPARLGRLLRQIRPLAAAEAEISVEANPGTVNQAVAATLVEGGVNRVTLGAQSFDDGELAFLGRIHRAGEVERAAEVFRAAGVDNLALDLIYAVPGQSLASWRRSLDAAVALQPRHVSCYALSFEDDTPLGDDLRAGRVKETADETQRRMFDLAQERLGAAGFEHYEISNFAQPDRRCEHNMVYWRNQPYLGLGPGACSYVAGWRRCNAPDVEAYVRSLHAEPPEFPPSHQEHLTGPKAMAETLMLALRLTEGVDICSFAQRFGLSPTEAFPGTFRRYIDQGAVIATATHLHLHREALFTANCILADLLAECE
ncbi:MAG: radical SAM family heme chaperone HemW [Phycisphaerae bacterium]|nr:radical SAM family heme chaperone HemW [Phycisphaerae bacterium]